MGRRRARNAAGCLVPVLTAQSPAEWIGNALDFVAALPANKSRKR